MHFHERSQVQVILGGDRGGIVMETENGLPGSKGQILADYSHILDFIESLSSGGSEAWPPKFAFGCDGASEFSSFNRIRNLNLAIQALGVSFNASHFFKKRKEKKKRDIKVSMRQILSKIRGLTLRLYSNTS